MKMKRQKRARIADYIKKTLSESEKSANLLSMPEKKNCKKKNPVCHRHRYVVCLLQTNWSVIATVVAAVS